MDNNSLWIIWFSLLAVLYRSAWGSGCESVLIKKGYEKGKGFWWGFFLGLLGLIIVSLMPVIPAQDVPVQTMPVKPAAPTRWDCPRCGRSNMGEKCMCGQTRDLVLREAAFNAARENAAIEELKKYKEKLDLGVITQEDYDYQKNRLFPRGNE